MKRLIKKAETWYHLTNDYNFNYNPYYQNKQTEIGDGLYITPIKDVSTWDILLRRREFAIPIEIDGLKILDLNNTPDVHVMQRELAKAGYSSDDVDKYLPSGDVFGKEPFEIASILAWAQYKGYDAIKPILDNQEGEQIVILSGANIQFGNPIKLDNLLNEYRRGKL